MRSWHAVTSLWLPGLQWQRAWRDGQHALAYLRPARPWSLLLLCLCLATVAVAQSPDDPIDDELLLARIEANCEALRAKGELKTVPELAKDCDGRRCELALAPAAKTPLPTTALRARLQQSTWIVGHYYLCDECKAWHFTASSGFAVGKDGAIATCFHLLEEDPQLPSACLVVAGFDGQVYPVTAVLAADHDADVVILQCSARNLVPLPLRLDAKAGERIYCFSNPDHQFACFTEGLIARRYVVRNTAPGTEPRPSADAPHAKDAAPPRAAGDAADHKHTLDPKAKLLTMLQVTCDFAMGSSGAPVTDDCGNVVGIAQSTSTVVVDPDADPVETQMISRSAVPAQVLRALTK